MWYLVFHRERKVIVFLCFPICLLFVHLGNLNRLPSNAFIFGRNQKFTRGLLGMAITLNVRRTSICNGIINYLLGKCSSANSFENRIYRVVFYKNDFKI